MRKFLSIAIVLGIGYVAVHMWGSTDRIHQEPTTSASVNEATTSASDIAEAFEQRRSNVQVEGRGEVIRVLADDTNGDRHQRFILRLDSGQTLLIAHNIDLAPRLSQLKKGDLVSFFGEYEWNDRGGVIHWTHKDPRGEHEAGWLKYRGGTYQ